MFVEIKKKGREGRWRKKGMERWGEEEREEGKEERREGWREGRNREMK
jgi:hypothetical protein